MGENPTQSQISSSSLSMLKALGIHLVLRKILVNLETGDLLTCRLVTSSWNDLATKILLSRQSLQVAFRYVNTLFILHQKSACPKLPPFHLVQFLELLQNSQLHNTIRKFPCAEFHFFGGPLDDPHLQDFLDNFGQQNVEHVHLDLIFSSPRERDCALIQKLLFLQALNLKSFHLKPPRELRAAAANPQSESNLNLLLPPLSSAQCLQHFPNLCAISGAEIPSGFAQQLIQSSKNLQSISLSLEIHTLNLLKFLAETGKLWMVKHLVFCPRPHQGNLEERDSDLDSKWDEIFQIIRDSLHQKLLSIRSFEVDLVRLGAPSNPQLNDRGNSLLLEILQSSSNSLEKLKAKLPLFNQSQRNWPVLKNVSHVELYLWEHQGFQLENFNLAQKFPSLRSIEFICKYYPENSNSNSDEIGVHSPWPCPFVGASDSVRQIGFSECLFPESYLRLLPYLSSAFPNLEQLTIENIEDFSRVGGFIWKCGNLKVLNLELKFNGKNKALAVDSTFTGFSREKCKMLHDQFETNEKSESERINSSILDLKKLEKLNMKILIPNEISAFHRVMSRVTAKYGFDCIQNLKEPVKIHLEIRPFGESINLYKYKRVLTALGEIAPFVNLIDLNRENLNLTD